MKIAQPNINTQYPSECQSDPNAAGYFVMNITLFNPEIRCGMTGRTWKRKKKAKYRLKVNHLPPVVYVKLLIQKFDSHTT
ncbi:hypothetical protein GCM10007082_23750 [Oceanisphaera arctica]|nr:hypothetical protein GCM10007082_23750 [Oceanisphaera arctica]